MNIMDQIGIYKDICPDKIAIKTDLTSISYKKLIGNVNRVSNGILKIVGNKRNIKIAMLLRNSIDFIEIFLASAKIGALVVPMDPKWSITQNSYVLDKYEPDIIFVQDLFNDNYELNKLKETIIIECSEEIDNDYNRWKMGHSHENPKTENDNDDLLIAFTSGTTGFPKGYVRSHSSWVESFYATNSELNINYNDCIMAPGPFVHSLSLYAMTHSLFIGSTFLLIDKFEPTKVLNFLQKSHNIVLYMVPTMIQSILNFIYENKYKNYSYGIKSIISSGDKWQEDSKKEVKKVFGDVNIYEFYGSSEASFVSILDPIGNALKPNSVGRAFKNVTISIRNDEGNELGINEIGKIFVKSKMLFSGYYKDDLGTKAIFRDNWLELGDYGKKDKDGYIYIVGRAKNMIISGGLNIYPEEIENILRKLEIVEEVAVIGRIHKYWGEEVVALMKIKDKAEFNIVKLKEYCSKYLPTYKRPHKFIQVKEFLYTSSGKISKAEIKKLLEGGNYD